MNQTLMEIMKEKYDILYTDILSKLDDVFKDGGTYQGDSQFKAEDKIWTENYYNNLFNQLGIWDESSNKFTSGILYNITQVNRNGQDQRIFQYRRFIFNYTSISGMYSIAIPETDGMEEIFYPGGSIVTLIDRYVTTWYKTYFDVTTVWSGYKYRYEVPGSPPTIEGVLPNDTFTNILTNISLIGNNDIAGLQSLNAQIEDEISRPSLSIMFRTELGQQMFERQNKYDVYIDIQLDETGTETTPDIHKLIFYGYPPNRGSHIGDFEGTFKIKYKRILTPDIDINNGNITAIELQTILRNTFPNDLYPEISNITVTGDFYNGFIITKNLNGDWFDFTIKDNIIKKDMHYGDNPFTQGGYPTPLHKLYEDFKLRSIIHDLGLNPEIPLPEDFD